LGYNYDTQNLEVWDDQLQTWVDPAFKGGTVAGATKFAGEVIFERGLNSTGPATFDSAVRVSGNLALYSGLVAPNLPLAPEGYSVGTFYDNGKMVWVCR
jgi:hypothetical protein